MVNPITKRYLESDYLEHNPEWDMQDSPWKADKVALILKEHGVEPKTFCEVGCGAGGVLNSLGSYFSEAQFTGYDIAPAAESFWKEIKGKEIEFFVGDFFSLNSQTYDVILLLDVLEHVADPHQFLLDIKPYTNNIVIHFPLDLSVLSVLREEPLLHVRRKVGHIHSFTKGLALELLDECGLEVVDWQYTGAAFSAPQRNLKTKIFGWFRRFVYGLHKDVGVRLLGGETLIVLAKVK